MALLDLEPTSRSGDGAERSTGPLLGRRAVVRSAVWTVPVVATAAAAPAFAVSCGTLTTGYLDWGANYARASSTSGTATVPITGGDPVTVTLSSVARGYNVSTNNFAITTGQVGGTGKRGFSMFQTVADESYLNNTNYGQLVTMTFSRPVYGLTFTMTDIDSATGDFIDAITVTSGSADWSVTKASGVTGTGTSTTTPLKANGTNTQVDNTTGTEGNAKFAWKSTASLTSVSFRYWNVATYTGNGIDPDQAVYLGPMTFQTYLTKGC